MTLVPNEAEILTESELLWRYREGFLTAKGFMVYAWRLRDDEGNRMLNDIKQLKAYCLKHGLSSANFYRVLKQTPNLDEP
jgi:hypothetical protein